MSPNFLYKCLLNLLFIVSNYVKDLFNYNFKEFLDYFKYGIKSWNYFENIENTTNNFCESYNNKLNNLLIKNLLILNYYIRLNTGIWCSKKNYEED